MDQSVGTCGACGGAVTVPGVFMSTIPPVPTCRGCGRKPKAAHGPVLEMEGYSVTTAVGAPIRWGMK